MAPKAKVPAPIDRPLSRAYLREFSGLSTAYPPGLSDPTSLRVMENMLINRDGSVRIRPGLRHLSYSQAPTEASTGVGFGFPPVGAHEAFYLNDGSKAYLFAARKPNEVRFFVLQFTGTNTTVRDATDIFDMPQGAAAVAFSSATRYVKYLQIDNKIFALSDAGETMRLFTVGTSKTAKRLSSIETPDWTVEDKLTVVHPDAAWVTGGLLSTRTNLVKNPSFESSVNRWTPVTYAGIQTSTAQHRSGERSMRIESLPLRTNLMKNPLTDVVSYGKTGWLDTTNNGNEGAITIDGDHARIGRIGAIDTAFRIYVSSPKFDVVAGKTYKYAHDLLSRVQVDEMGLRVRWFNASGAAIGSPADFEMAGVVGARGVRNIGVAPAGAVQGQVQVWLKGNAIMYIELKNVMLCELSEGNAIFDGDSGANYFWTGTAGLSASVYHPPSTVSVQSENIPVAPLATITGSAYARADSATRTYEAALQCYDADGALVNSYTVSGPAESNSAWNRATVTHAMPAGATQVALAVAFVNVARGEYHYIDDAMVNVGAIGTYFDGSTADTPTVDYAWSGAANDSVSSEKTYSSSLSVPAAETKTAETLISTGVTDHHNDFNFGFFYTFNNEVGESAASQVTVVRAQRAWGQWKWEQPNGAGEPDPASPTLYPERAADQLVAIIPQDVFDEALAQGALNWSLYMLTWSNQDNVPIEAVKVATTELTPESTYAAKGWARVTPQTSVATDLAIVPSLGGRYNYSNPSSGGNGLVAADRMVLVKDPAAAAVIKWTSNNQGSYTDFTASKGGGYKTLTSGNLMIPACVKLWQNPQSADTLTILCLGTDGHSTGYYMAPATITSQSDTTPVMGFEETTATPGTTSPYGCEVFNNALYHPLDEQLMKSTASNYNINHKSLTDQIEYDWKALETKQWIISSQHDNRLYFIVNNPAGEELIEGNCGNEIWVYDAASDTGTWSRFLIQAHSLRKIEQGGRIYMSVLKHDGIFYLDPDYDRDDTLDETFHLGTAWIPWRLETNVQGANRAHDAWAQLQQMELVLGNFTGSLQWGLRSWDVNGKAVNVKKIKRDLGSPSDDGLPWDVQDKLLIRKGLQEWYFYASSVVTDDELERSSGQLNSVQYRYAPLSVNDGYERGSVETFEYGRETANYGSTRTDAGVPQPFTDTRRP